jgi:hypothetical protein
MKLIFLHLYTILNFNNLIQIFATYVSKKLIKKFKVPKRIWIYNGREENFY